MKVLVRVLTVLALAALLVAAVPGPTPGTTTPGFGSLSVIYWVPVTQDTAGELEAAVTYEVCIAVNGVDMNISSSKALKTIPTTKPELQIGPYLSGLPLGIAYRVFVRAIDDVGNASLWSNFIQGPIDSRPPMIPSGVGNKLRMIVDVIEVQR